jgi:hypothetical protein
MGWDGRSRQYVSYRNDQFCPAIAFAYAADGGAEVPELMHDKLIVHVYDH